MSEKFKLNQPLTYIILAILVIGLVISVSYIVTNNNQGDVPDGANNRPAIEVDETATELQKFNKIKEDIREGRAKLYEDYDNELELIDEAIDRAFGYSDPEFVQANLIVRKTDFENKILILNELEKVDCEILIDTQSRQCKELKEKLQTWVNKYEEIYSTDLDFSDGYNPTQRNKEKQLTFINQAIDFIVDFKIYNENNPDLLDLTY